MYYQYSTDHGNGDAAKPAVNDQRVQQYCDKPEWDSLMIGMITTKMNDLMMTYFYLGYGINNVIPTGKKPQTQKKTH